MNYENFLNKPMCFNIFVDIDISKNMNYLSDDIFEYIEERISRVNSEKIRRIFFDVGFVDSFTYFLRGQAFVLKSIKIGIYALLEYTFLSDNKKTYTFSVGKEFFNNISFINSLSMLEIE
jgi:hypothetical protein